MQEKNKDLQNQSPTIKKMAKGTYISIITLNANGLNAPIKGTDWLNVMHSDKAQIRPIYILSTRNPLQT